MSALPSRVGRSLKSRSLGQLRAMFANLASRGLLGSHARMIKAMVQSTASDALKAGASSPDDLARGLKATLLEALRKKTAQRLQLAPSQLVNPASIPTTQIQDTAANAYLQFGKSAHKVLGRRADEASTFVYESLPVSEQTKSWLVGEADNVRDTLREIARAASEAGRPVVVRKPVNITRTGPAEYDRWYSTSLLGSPHISRKEVIEAAKRKKAEKLAEKAKEMVAESTRKEFSRLAKRASEWADFISPRTVTMDPKKMVTEESKDLLTRLASEPQWLEGRARGSSSSITGLVDTTRPISVEKHLQVALNKVSRKIQAIGARKIRSYGPKISKAALRKLKLHTEVWHRMVNEITIDDRMRRAVLRGLNRFYYPKLKAESQARRAALKKFYQRWPKPQYDSILDSL